MPDDDDPDLVPRNVVKEMVWEILQVHPPQPTRIEMGAQRIRRNNIQFFVKFLEESISRRRGVRIIMPEDFPVLFG